MWGKIVKNKVICVRGCGRIVEISEKDVSPHQEIPLVVNCPNCRGSILLTRIYARDKERDEVHETN